MLRRASSIAFVLAVALVAGCGHQVTPSPNLNGSNNDLSGHMTVKFQVDAPFDFTNVVYMIAIDTCGAGVPYPQAAFTGYSNYTFAFLIGGGFGNTALPVLYQYYLNSNSSGMIQSLPVDNLNQSTTQFIANYNGQGTEFSFTFLRSDLNNPLGVPLPCPNSVAPSATPTASPTVLAGPTPTPTAVPSGAATPTATPSPGPTATGFNPYLTTWTFNLMTFSTSHPPVPLDSLGLGGPTDTSFTGIVVDTTQTQSPSSFRGTPDSIRQNLASYITYGEVNNFP